MKFFLFRREQISESSVKSSDSGIGLSVFVIPISKMGFMTATKGAINITFNDAGMYEAAALLGGESLEKTNVKISCIAGQELNLMENILEFVTSTDPNKLVMRFDVVTGKSTFDSAIADNVSDISTTIKTKPIVMSSGEISKGDTQKEFLDTIGGIYFGDNKPSLDFNHEGLASYADDDEIAAWVNSGTSGSLHNIATNVGAPAVEFSSALNGLSKTSAAIGGSDYFVIPNAYTVLGEYTLYMALGINSSTSITSVLYGDAEGETMGFCMGEVKDATGIVGKCKPGSNTFKVRHSERTGEIASVSTANDDEGTVKYKFPEGYHNSNDTTIHVFVIRRDHKSNMFIHNGEGELVGFIPGFTSKMTPGGKRTDMASMTDGSLLIEQLGSGGSITVTASDTSFKGSVARFGVIEKDIGTSKAGQLARDLFNLYNF